MAGAFGILTLLAVITWGVDAAQGQSATSVDWIVNFDDTGYDPIAAGGIIVYTATVNTRFGDPAPQTTLTLALPADMQFVGSTGDITGCAPKPATGPATITCTVPAIASGQTHVLKASVIPKTEGLFTVIASVPETVGAITDPDPSNNTVPQQTTVTKGADIALAISGPVDGASGSAADYTFTATNLGPYASGRLRLTVPKPVGIEGITTPAGCSLFGDTYTCEFPGPVPVGGSADVTFKGFFAVGANSTVTVLGNVSTNDPPDPITANNRATFDSFVTAGSDVKITKTRSPAGNQILVGEQVTFTLAASYTGDNPFNLTITDPIPSNYRVDSVTPSAGSGWTCDPPAQTVSCTLPSGVGPGRHSLGSIEIKATVITAGDDIVNTATISSEGPYDPDLDNNEANDGGASLQDPKPVLRANKSGPNPPLVVEGQVYSWRLSTTNTGNAPFVGTMTMTDVLPALLEFQSFGPPDPATDGWTCSTVGTGPVTVICTRDYTLADPLPAKQTTPAVVINAKVLSPGPTRIDNCMTVSGTGQTDSTACYGATPSPGPNTADIGVLKTAAVSPLASGEVQTFRIELFNNGPQTSTNIALTDRISDLINASGPAPEGAGVVSAPVVVPGSKASGVVCDFTSNTFDGKSRELSCSIASLEVCTPGSDCPVITVEVRPGGNAGTRNNTVSAYSRSVADPDASSDPTNNVSTVTFQVTPSFDLGVTKQATPTSPRAGEQLIYVITAFSANDGRSTAPGVSIRDTLPDDVRFISAVPSLGTCGTKPTPGSTTAPGNNLLECDFGPLAPNTQRTVTVIVSPNVSWVGRNDFTNNVSVETTDPASENGPNPNTASVTNLVRPPQLDLLVNKTDSPDPISVGEQTVYTLTATNIGPSAANTVVITDDLPPSFLVYISHTTSSGGSCDIVPAARALGGQLRCTFTRLDANESAQVFVTMEGVSKGIATNKATVTSTETLAGYDSVPENNRAEELTTVSLLVDMAVTSKQPSKNPVDLNEAFDFVIDVVNRTDTGLTSEAEDVFVDDRLPAGMVLAGQPGAQVTSGTASANSCSGASGQNVFRCGFGTVSNGGTIRITAPVRVVTVTSAPQSFTNRAAVTTSSRDQNPSNNANTGTVTVNALSLSGIVFRDFNGSGVQDPGDTGVAGVTMTAAGIGAGGSAFSTSVVTRSNGTYTVFVPPGDYSVTRGPASAAGFTNGQAIPGSAGGTAQGATQIAGIALSSGAATAYNFTLVPAVNISISKALLAGPTVNPDGSFEAAFRLTIGNTSIQPLVNVVVTDQLAGGPPLFGSFAANPTQPGTYGISAAPSGSCGGLNGGFNGSGDSAVAQGFTLDPNTSCTVDFAIRVMPSIPLPPLQNGARYFNQAEIVGQGGVTGEAISAASQLVPLSPDLGQMIIAKVLMGYQDKDGSGNVTLDDVLNFKVTASNTGSVPLTNVVVTDTTITPDRQTCPVVQPNDTCALTGTYTITITDVQAGAVVNTATAESNETAPVTVTLTTPVVAVIDDTKLTKTALVSTAKRGEKVPYEIVAEKVPFNPARIVDLMPPAFNYVPGSAVANGQKVEPEVDGRRLTFEGLVPDSKGRIKLALTLVATAAVSPGTAVNQAQLVDPRNGEVVATARARVTILAEAVFDCGDIIGKVFDDKNRNGYQDEGEPGLPAVRVATVHGLLVTTDPNGRFNIPCADIPDADIGSNFILKLDTRTLPTGYRVTTENPRRVRLTRGKVVKLNFGASISRLVKLELNGKVFAQGSDALNPKWQAGLDRLVAALEAETSVLVITYRGADDALAHARLRAVKEAVIQRWSAVRNRYDLAIDTRIVTGGGP